MIKKTSEIKTFYPTTKSEYIEDVRKFNLNKDNSPIKDYREWAEYLLKKEQLLDDTAALPHIQLRFSYKYRDCFLVDALFKGTDGALYWCIAEDFESVKENIQEIEFDELPIYLIHACLEQISQRL